jgi:ABC-type sugar transport system permease subunit
MKYLKALLLLVVIALPILVVLPVSAQDTTQSDTGSGPFSEVCQRLKDLPDNQKPSACAEVPDNPITGKDGIITKVVHLLLIVIGVASIIMIMVGGLQYILSSGDPARVNSAKNTILYAVIGLVVAVLSQVIITFVIRRI